MRHRIARFSVHQTALVVAVLYALLGLLIVPIIFLVGRLAVDDDPMPVFMIVLLPLLYGLFGYIFTAIGCWLYNLIAGWVGGIELTLDPRPEAEIPPSLLT